MREGSCIGRRHRRAPVLPVIATVLAASVLCPLRCIPRVERLAASPPCHQQQGHPASGDQGGAGCQCHALLPIVDGTPRPNGFPMPLQLAAVEPATPALLPGAGAGHPPAVHGAPENTGPPVYLRGRALRL